MKRLLFFVALQSLLLSIGFAGDFRNLRFDEADTRDLPPPGGRPTDPASVEKLLPGWRLELGTTPQFQILLNPLLVPEPGGDYAELGDRQEFGLTEGRFALLFHRGSPDSPQWKLSQIGTIPIGARLLTYRN